MSDLDRVRLSTNTTVARYRVLVDSQDRHEIVKFLRERFTERYIRPVRSASRPHGFFIMAIACLFVEAIQSCASGWQQPTEKRKKPYREFFAQHPAFRVSTAHMADELYDHVRSGILHQGETKNGWRILRTGRHAVDFATKTINATLFFEEVVSSSIAKLVNAGLDVADLGEFSESDEWVDPQLSGQHLSISMHEVIKPPSLCTPRELKHFSRLVRLGGQVALPGLARRIESARLLGFSYDGDQLTAAAALKSPAAKYKNGVFATAGLFQSARQFQIELGWAYTLKAHRGEGRCRRLIDRLLKLVEHENVFATTAAENLPMQGILQKAGFEPLGRPFHGREGKQLHLWVRWATPNAHRAAKRQPAGDRNSRPVARLRDL